MKELLEQVKELEKTEVGELVRQRLKEFKSFEHRTEDEWFSELCFCILTANSKASTAIAIHEELADQGFREYGFEEVRDTIRKHKHRFHNNKAKYILEARKHTRIKEIITSIVEEAGVKEAREWLVKNVKGYGYKEASHFLRNVGYKDIAILDRHIINLMMEYGYLNKKPKNLNRKNYLSIEKKFQKMASEVDMNMAELDLYMWYLKAGEVLR